ncbi:serine protease inhibitor Cvsi-2-like [Mytilus trossulus]|uniref:serine protease inhibitor Cvsi-2-like n=1 Tax=Mytilus trossulus TaxID=6551 RepID=UPI00300614AC
MDIKIILLCSLFAVTVTGEHCGAPTDCKTTRCAHTHNTTCLFGTCACVEYFGNACSDFEDCKQDDCVNGGHGHCFEYKCLCLHHPIGHGQ